MAVNFTAWDKHELLSVSEAAHLWLGEEPPEMHPGLTGNLGVAFWRWLKKHIYSRAPDQGYPKGFHSFPRNFYAEIAGSDEYAALVRAEPRLPSKPKFLFPKERAGTRKTIAAETECRAWLAEMMKAGPKAKKKEDWQADAASKFKVGTRAFGRAWANALIDSGDPHEWIKTGRLKKNS